jgi:hypothetical protein
MPLKTSAPQSASFSPICSAIFFPYSEHILAPTTATLLFEKSGIFPLMYKLYGASTIFLSCLGYDSISQDKKEIPFSPSAAYFSSRSQFFFRSVIACTWRSDSPESFSNCSFFRK